MEIEFIIPPLKKPFDYSGYHFRLSIEKGDMCIHALLSSICDEQLTNYEAKDSLSVF